MPSKKPMKQAGTFDVSPDHHIFGELKLAGPRTKLQLHSPNFFATHRIPDGCITGVLNDLTHVSLFGCITPGAPGSSSGPSGEYFFAKVVPHYAISGTHHLRPTDLTITKVVLYLTDGVKLFYDFDAYGSAFFDAEQLVKHLIKEEPHRKSYRTGPDARIL